MASSRALRRVHGAGSASISKTENRTRLTARARAVLEPFDTFGVEAVNPVRKRLPLHTGASRRIRAAGALQHRGNRQKPAGLIGIGRNAGHVPRHRRRMLQARDLNGPAIPLPNQYLALGNHIGWRLGTPAQGAKFLTVGISSRKPPSSCPSPRKRAKASLLGKRKCKGGCAEAIRPDLLSVLFVHLGLDFDGNVVRNHGRGVGHAEIGALDRRNRA